jgi:pimeloyl-ACP methyl ester carboxylesterase
MLREGRIFGRYRSRMLWLSKSILTEAGFSFSGVLSHQCFCGKHQSGGKPALVLHGGASSGCSRGSRRLFDPNVYRIVLFDPRGPGRKHAARERAQHRSLHEHDSSSPGLPGLLEFLKGCWRALVRLDNVLGNFLGGR